MFAQLERFIMRSNFKDLTVGFTANAAFTAVAISIATDLVVPFMAWSSG